MQRVLDTAFFLLHLGLGRRADVQHGHAAGELRQPLLQLFLVVIGRGLLDLGLDLRLTAFDLIVLALASTSVVLSLSTMTRLARRDR